MRRPALYSQSRQAPLAAPARPEVAPPASRRSPRVALTSSLAALRHISPTDPRLLWSAMALLALALVVCITLLLARAPRVALT